MTHDIEIKCETGKSLIYREMSPSETLDFILACGSEGASNEAYFNIAQQWSSIRSIDGIPLPFPRNRGDINNIANMLGSEGIRSIEQFLEAQKETTKEDLPFIKK